MADKEAGGKKRNRSAGTGSVYYVERRNRWAAALDLGWDETGRRRRKATYHKTKRKAEEALAEMLTDLRRGEVVDTTTMTVREYMAEWLEHVRPPVVAERTWLYYEQINRVHITPELGRIKLAQLSPVHIQRLYKSRLEMGRSPRTVRHINEVLRNALGQAVRWQLIPQNPAERVKPPQVVKLSMKRQFLTFEEAQAWLRSIQGHPLETLFLAAIFTGMRKSELLGLPWANVDLERGEVTVAQTVWIRKGGQIEFHWPKDKEARTIPLPPAVVAKLRAHRAQQAWKRRMAGDAWTDYGLVWTRDDGKPLRQEYAYRQLQRSLDAAGLKRIRFHDLRHSAATLLLALGVPLKDVSEWLGHAGIEITADLYGHVLPDAHRQAALKLEERLLGQ